MNTDNVGAGTSIRQDAGDKSKRHGSAHAQFGIVASFIKPSVPHVYRRQLSDTAAARSSVKRNSLSTLIFGKFRSMLNTNWRLFLAAFALMSLSQVANAQTVLPAAANSPCIFRWFQVPGWFPSPNQQSIPLNGLVNPADSIDFPLPDNSTGSTTNCDFFRWSSQMFLWLTSPAPADYGQGSHVFNSPVFYDVSPPDATTGRRTLIRISPGNLRSFGVSIPQLGPQGKPVVFDNTGKMFTVIRPQVGPGGKTLIRNKAGQPVEIARIQVARNGKPIFRDKAGKAIDFRVARNGSPLILDRAGKQIDFRTTIKIINGKSFYQGGAGNLIDIEQGQADGSVLMAQTGSLVYYALQVNDVYASFLTGQKMGRITAAHFPTTQPELTNIETFAGTTFPDAKVLTVELKSAWIEAAGLDVNKYVTITATIPAYTPPLTPPLKQIPITDKAVQSGSPRQATLALVGMHIVGTVLGHPEMIWATFEHIDNTPNAPYTYIQTGTGVTGSPPITGGTWLFSATPTATTSENARMGLNGADIAAISPANISPANILRVNPWGTAAQDPNFTANNTDIIAINLSAFALLATDDVRKNYILTGTTWTSGDPTDPISDPVNQFGTNQMANTTMETFQQPSHCFNCHNGNMLGTFSGPPPTADGLSHIFGPLQPLITK